MRVAMDTHVHLYPVYDLVRSLLNLALRLSSFAAEGARVACLAERHDCHLFSELRDGTREVAGVEAVPVPGDESALAVGIGGKRLFLLAGRQVVTAERIEILALTADADIPDGLSAPDTVRAIEAAGAVPVVSWAPGKWSFSRGDVVRALLDTFGPETLLLGDTTLRPAVWPEPAIMKAARRRGFAVCAGSDPLPFEGEEYMMGRYVSVFEGDFDERAPTASVRALLRERGAAACPAGRRGAVGETLSRLLRNHFA